MPLALFADRFPHVVGIKRIVQAELIQLEIVLKTFVS